MTYSEVEAKYPEVSARRATDKLRYRYPRGESYEDVIKRLEAPMLEMERIGKPIVIVAHQAVLRCVYAYFNNIPVENIPYLSIPLHTVIKITPSLAAERLEERYRLNELNNDLDQLEKNSCFPDPS
jgi:broad specificity phosphatase PhoE